MFEILVVYLGVDTVIFTIIKIIFGLSGLIILISAVILIIIHGFKNDDIYMIIAGFIRISFQIYLILIGMVISWIVINF